MQQKAAPKHGAVAETACGAVFLSSGAYTATIPTRSLCVSWFPEDNMLGVKSDVPTRGPTQEFLRRQTKSWKHHETCKVDEKVGNI